MIQITISTYGKNLFSTIITIGPSLLGLRGAQLAGSINYTLVNDLMVTHHACIDYDLMVTHHAATSHLNLT
jgi:hypothetical protein